MQRLERHSCSGQSVMRPSGEDVAVDFQTSNELATALRQTAFPLVYRMLGSVSETEDIVQEGLLRMEVATRQGTSVENPHAFFVSVTTRLAIDHLRSARHKRELYPGEWLPE